MAANIQYVTLGVAEELFAAPVEKVQEILDASPIARLPQAPVNLLGMIDVRGQGVPVIDLRLTLGLEPADDTQNTRIVVLIVSSMGADRVIGLRADRVFEVTMLDEDTLDPPPEVNGTWSGRSISGIGRRQGRFVTVLDIDRLLGSAADAAEPRAA